MDVSKKDWKLFCEKISGWQERYMERLEDEYIKLLLYKEKSAADRFWELYNLMRLDKKNPGVLLQSRKSELDLIILRLLRNDVITFEELDEFSDELKETIKVYLRE